MTHQPVPRFMPSASGAGPRLAQLRQVLRLVEQIAGVERERDADLDQGARVGSAYADALPIVQRRFDALAAE
ncbi:MAG TPA: hypothetical protein VGW34_14010, partial [Allosphingosinicella sp.]|nr:hypothetical protein [Allosphingosinicella sp.]